MSLCRGVVVVCRLVVVVCVVTNFVAGEDCVEQKPWTDYRSINFQAKCPGIGTDSWGVNPRFDEPTGCESKAVVHELAHVIANNGFDCSKWCVFSLQTDTAWMWNSAEKCWSASEGCNGYAQEKEEAKRLAGSLCPASSCKPLQPASALTLATVQDKCPNHHETSTPAFHKSTTCDGESDPRNVETLALSLANGVYMACTHWCVFSVRSPATLAWIWNPSAGCWKRDTSCLKHKAEVDYAMLVRDSLCHLPCADPVPGSALSEEFMAAPSMCPGYKITDGAPALHSANTCSGQKGSELAESLANKAFNGCGSWCVFSLRTPTQLAWKWNPPSNCWEESPSCVSIEAERDHTIILAKGLCLDASPTTIPVAAPPPPPPARPPPVAEDSKQQEARANARRGAEARAAAELVRKEEAEKDKEKEMLARERARTEAVRMKRAEAEAEAEATRQRDEAAKKAEEERKRKESTRNPVEADELLQEDEGVGTPQGTGGRRERLRRERAEAREQEEKRQRDIARVEEDINLEMEALEDEKKPFRGRVVRQKDSTTETYKVIGGMLLVVGALVMAVVCTKGDDNKSKKKY